MSNPKVIGVGGLLASGKDVFADALVGGLGFVKMGMSDPLADALYVLNPLVGEDTGMRWQTIIDSVGYTRAKEIPEVRRLLQVMGTEVGRQMIDNEVWVNIARRNIKRLTDEGTSVVLTGVRYLNELSLVTSMPNSTTVWIERPGTHLSMHLSETSVQPEDFNVQLLNDKSIRELKDKALEVARG